MMSKRDFDLSDNQEGPSSKMRKIDDSDEGGGAGRTGRVRKKSAKVLEMEEFEQAEKTSGSKKGKTPKGAPSAVSESTPASSRLFSSVADMVQDTPVARKSKKEVGFSRAVPAELMLRSPQKPKAMSVTVDSLPPVQVSLDIKPDLQPPATLLASPPTAVVKQEETKSVIKTLLSSPGPGSSQHITTGILSKSNSGKTAPIEPGLPAKKASKKIKLEEKAVKVKDKKMKIEIMSPSELGPPLTSSATPAESKPPSLKMKITSGLNPMAAQVLMEPGGRDSSPLPKSKKVPKKPKTPKMETVEPVKLEITPEGDEEKGSKKKKSSKKKEKLIQEAISAAQQMPSLAAFIGATPQAQGALQGDTPSPVQKPSKKKVKSSPGSAQKDPNTSDSLVMDFDDDDEMDVEEGGESNLVIAETEKKKKKSIGKKKVPKEKDENQKMIEKAKKVPKRAPTAYMLFCNTHRPTIVEENPGIEFASISRKLGELWQTQSNKQKLQWRRKAQRRMKKSNLISTGKNGKESQGGPSSSSGSMTKMAAPQSGSLASTNQRLALMIQRNKPTMPVDEGPLSPSKNFSIEPLDVAAHLKLLGESLSIIGMRLQEHKGMIAVQGSLSVLLDSLLCACGPLLCLTQQVPGMDGCAPTVHAQTLDSVAYVMPGL